MRLAALGLLVGAVELTVVLLTRLHLRVRHQRQVPSTKSMAPSRAASFRWTAVTGVAVIGAAVVATIGAPGASGQTASGGFNKGTGSAYAESIRVDPVVGGLSFGVAVGESLAGHQNTAASAESRAANYGLIGDTLAAESCDGGDPVLPEEDQPSPLSVQSGEEGAEAGMSGQDPNFPGVDREVRATTAPYAEALTSAGNLDIPGALSVQGTRAFASSGVDGEQREAVARTEIARVIVAGVVELRGMVWEAIHRSGAVDEQRATFTFGSMSINGVPIPVDDPLAALSQVNDVLRPLGFELNPPRSHVDETSRGTVATVDPLGLRVIPSPTRDGVVSPILSATQPVRNDLFNALIELDCGNASYITVLDIVLNAFGPGGYFAVELGGVQASTAEINRFRGLGTLGSLPPLPSTGPAGSTLEVPGSSSSLTRSGSAPSSGAAAPGDGAMTTGAAGTPDQSIDDAVNAISSRGGMLAGVGAGGLLLLAAVAEGDRRKMLRAMREIPMEA